MIHTHFPEGGAAGGGTQRQETCDYNNRLQPVRIQLGTSGTPNANYCLVYNYYLGVANPTTCTGTPGTATSGNNGNVMGYFYQDTTNPSLGHTVAYGYDALNRLTSAAATGSSTYSFTFSYDRFGNMTCNASNGQCASLSFPPNNGSTTNRTTTSGYSWDAAGNLVQDPSAANPAYGYQWDAEGRLATITQGASTYSTSTYNANGQVVENVYPGLNAKVEGLFDPWGQELGYYNGVGNAWWDRDIRLGGRMFAQSFPSATYFLHADHLGSDSQITDQSGAFKADFLYYPWQNWKYAGNMVDAHFAGFQQSGGANYPTPTRLYSGGQGRWLSPDPLGGDITNPQSLNRYAYVLNNPTTLTDPLGLDSGSCSDPSYFWSHAECGGPPPCVAYGTEGCIPPPPGYPGGGGGGGAGGGGGTVGGGTAGGSTGATAPPAGGWPNGGDYGPIYPMSLWDLLGPPGTEGVCDFGVCGGDMGANGFQAGAAAGAAPWIIRITVWAWPYIVAGAEAIPWGTALGLVLAQNGSVPAAARAKPQVPARAQPQPSTEQAKRYHFEVCTNAGSTLDPQNPALKICHYVCPSGRVETRVQEAWRHCEPKVVFGP